MKSLKLDCHLPKTLLYLLHRKLFKSDERCFLFHVKRLFRSQDKNLLNLLNDLIEEIRLISKFMLSQPD